MVKADAYGHGAARVAAVAIEAGAAELGVATIDEALGLRAAASQRRCWRGCMPWRRLRTRSRPTSKSGCRRNTRSSPCWMRATHWPHGKRDVEGRDRPHRNGLAAADFPAVLTGLRNAAATARFGYGASCHIWRMAMCRMIR